MFVVVAVLGAGGVGYAAFVRRPAGGATVTVDIAPGETTAQIASKLAQEKVIGSALWFRIIAKVRGVDGKIEAGRYQLRRGMGTMAALDVLGGTPGGAGVSVTIPEGFTVQQIAARLGARTKIAASVFSAAVTDGSVRATIEPENVKSLEGLLFPQTYLIVERDTPDGIAQRMVAEFEDATASVDWSGAEQRALSRYQAVIVASLVEREAKVPQDRAKVAAVIYNRLAKGMRLQIDATALYGLPEHKVPTLADLRRPSPYNTYLIRGLPPTPIASPGLASIDAAVHPAPIDALYYVVCATDGHHCFTNSPAEFERLKRLRPAGTH
jgi:UPF0755 protein